MCRIQIILTQFIRQAGIGVGRYAEFRDAGHLRDVLTQLIRAQGTVQTNGQRPSMPQAVVEGFYGLAGQGAPRGICDGAGYHQWQANFIF
ncbi:hypothetical protein BMS3Bbin11_00428 [bacterium BMS3Bbin11]|nr:hypothetical protein BMS3Bbin11_00428 [bacterium BMS3Bbin11]